MLLKISLIVFSRYSLGRESRMYVCMYAHSPEGLLVIKFNKFGHFMSILYLKNECLNFGKRYRPSRIRVDYLSL